MFNARKYQPFPAFHITLSQKEFKRWKISFFLSKCFLSHLEMFLYLKFLTWCVNFFCNYKKCFTCHFSFLVWNIFLFCKVKNATPAWKIFIIFFSFLVWKIFITSEHFHSRCGKLSQAEISSHMRKFSKPGKKIFHTWRENFPCHEIVWVLNLQYYYFGFSLNRIYCVI